MVMKMFFSRLPRTAPWASRSHQRYADRDKHLIVWEVDPSIGRLIYFASWISANSQGLENKIKTFFILPFSTHSPTFWRKKREKKTSPLTKGLVHLRAANATRPPALQEPLLLCDWMWGQRHISHFMDWYCHFVLARTEPGDKQRKLSPQREKRKSSSVQRWMDYCLKSRNPFLCSRGKIKWIIA